MEITLVALVVLALTVVLVALAGAALVFFRTSEHSSTGKRKSKKAPEAEAEPYLVTLAAKVAAIEVRQMELEGIWTDERKRMKQHADRAQQAERDAEKRAARESEEGEELEEFDPQQLQLLDGTGGPQSGMYTVPESVGAGLAERGAEALAVFGRR